MSSSMSDKVQMHSQPTEATLSMLPALVCTPHRRIAIMNCDWDHLKAVDILSVLLSFKPQNGKVHRVTIYLSDFGMEKIAEEARLGPGFLRDQQEAKAINGANGKQPQEQSDDDEEDDDGSLSDEGEEEEEEGEDFDQEKLRAYEVQKLRYYFAIAECDSVSTAMAVSDEVDGLEFENSSVQLDSRFVPDDVSFEGRKVKDVVEALPSTYGKYLFVYAIAAAFSLLMHGCVCC